MTNIIYEKPLFVLIDNYVVFSCRKEFDKEIVKISKDEKNILIANKSITFVPGSSFLHGARKLPIYYLE